MRMAVISAPPTPTNSRGMSFGTLRIRTESSPAPYLFPARHLDPHDPLPEGRPGRRLGHGEVDEHIHRVADRGGIERDRVRDLGESAPATRAATTQTTTASGRVTARSMPNAAPRRPAVARRRWPISRPIRTSHCEVFQARPASIASALPRRARASRFAWSASTQGGNPRPIQGWSTGPGGRATSASPRRRPTPRPSRRSPWTRRPGPPRRA